MTLFLIFILLLGLSVGSFINVLIYRIPLGKGLLGRSYCDYCKRQLPWYDLIPLFSFIFLLGRCRYCKKKIDWYMPLVELVTALLFASLFFKFPILTDYKLWFNLFFVSFLITIFFTDLKSEIIPDKILFPTLFISLIYVLFDGNFVNHILAGIGTFLLFLILAIITHGKGMGGGDVKFSSVLGLVLGFPLIVICLYLAFLTGGIISLILILWRKKRFKKDTIPFGPFLAFCAIISVFMGDRLVSLLLSFL